MSRAAHSQLQDMVEQTYAVLESRGAPRRTLRPSWVLRWLEQGKSPQDIVNLAIGKPRPRPDAHLGGIDS